MSTQSVQLMLCVNDVNSGNPTGHVSILEVTSENLVLSGDYLYDDANPTFRLLDAPLRIRVGRRVFPIQGYAAWVGNWCWDEVLMQREDARKLIAHVLKRGFTIEEHDEENSDLLPVGGAA